MTAAFFERLAGRRVLITGHTGFKGSWLSLWLASRGAIVAGYALEPPTVPSNFIEARVAEVLAEHHLGDIRDEARLSGVVRQFRPELILHLAAQTVVLDGYDEPRDTYSVNVMGTATLLEAVRRLRRPVSIVAVSTDKVYANDDSGRAFRESDPLGGRDPYSASKAAAELVVASYRGSFFPPESIATHGVALASGRAGNVLGGGDWTSHGLVADTFRALVAGQAVEIRRPDAIRPWQHVLEPLAGYLRLAVRLLGPDPARFCRAWNFGPARATSSTVGEVVNGLVRGWGGGRVERSPACGPHESGILRISSAAARRELDARPMWGLGVAIARTAAWFRRWADQPTGARDACLADLRAYEQRVRGEPG